MHLLFPNISTTRMISQYHYIRNVSEVNDKVSLALMWTESTAVQNSEKIKRKGLLAQARHQCRSGTSTHDYVVGHNYSEECQQCVQEAVRNDTPYTGTPISSNTSIFLSSFVNLHTFWLYHTKQSQHSTDSAPLRLSYFRLEAANAI